MRLTLYVKGVKKLAGEEDRSYSGYVVQTMMGGSPAGGSGLREYPDYKVYKEAVYKSVLPKDQQAIFEMLGEMSRIHKFDLRVIDVTKANFLRRLWLQKAKRIRVFPTVVSDRGRRIEGHVTGEHIKTLVSE